MSRFALIDKRIPMVLRSFKTEKELEDHINYLDDNNALADYLVVSNERVEMTTYPAKTWVREKS